MKPQPEEGKASVKNIKDYLPFYLGCEVECGDEPIGILNGIYSVKGNLSNIYWPSRNESGFYETSLIKPFLRPLSDMTVEEAIEVTRPIVVYGDIPNARTYGTYKNSFGKIVVSWGNSNYEKYVPADEASFVPKQYIYLLKQGFDLFGLIESNLAIDATKIKNHV